MPRKLFKRFVPDTEVVKKYAALRVLGDWIHDPNLFHINRRSTSLAFFIGFFMAFMPIPSQMLVAAVVAIWWRANLPISVGLVWITNPLTIPPIFYMCFKVGSWLLGTEPRGFQFELTWEWFNEGLKASWQPLLLGCIVCGLVAGLLGAGVVRWFWRFHVLQRWQARQKLRLLRKRDARDSG